MNCTIYQNIYIVLHALAVAQPQIALNVITVKGFFLTNLDGGVCQRDLNEYELSCCGGIMLCLAVSIVV